MNYLPGNVAAGGFVDLTKISLHLEENRIFIVVFTRVHHVSVLVLSRRRDVLIVQPARLEGSCECMQ
jgi:hypothetical protein